MEHLHFTFDQELAGLKDLILTMGVEVQEMIHQAVSSLEKLDVELAKKTIKRGVRVDELELEIDEMCVNLIALRQPKAGDLRFITTGMRIATDLERIGDLAEDIAERAIVLCGEPLLKPLIDIPKMARLAQDSVALVLEAFINRDPDKARAIWEKETEADKLRDQIYNELLEIVAQDGKTVNRAVPLLLVSLHLERICDHTTNIAEDVIYMVQAQVIKHKPHNNRA